MPTLKQQDKQIAELKKTISMQESDMAGWVNEVSILKEKLERTETLRASAENTMLNLKDRCSDVTSIMNAVLVSQYPLVDQDPAVSPHEETRHNENNTSRLFEHMLEILNPPSGAHKFFSTFGDHARKD